MTMSRLVLMALFVLLAGSVAVAGQAGEPAPAGAGTEAAPASEAPEGPLPAAEPDGPEEAPETDLPLDPFADVIPVDHCGPTGFHASSKAECQASCAGPSHYVQVTGCCYCA